MTCFQKKHAMSKSCGNIRYMQTRPLVWADGVMRSPNHIPAAVVFLEMRETVGPAT